MTFKLLKCKTDSNIFYFQLYDGNRDVTCVASSNEEEYPIGIKLDKLNFLSLTINGEFSSITEL